MSPRNFVLLFREREGSSAIIELLGHHPQLRVPVFEQMDQHWAGANGYDHQSIAQLADLTFATGDFATARHLLAHGGPPPPSDLQGVGFKWRIWGPEDRIIDMLVARRVVVLHLFRVDLLDLVSSLVLTSRIIPHMEQDGANLGGGGHPQFALLTMDAAARASFRKTLAGIRFSIDPAECLSRAQAMIAFKRDVHRRFLHPLIARGVPVFSVLYEDFLAVPQDFMRALCRVLGVTVGALDGRDSYFSKVMPGGVSAQVENLAHLERLPALRDLTTSYRGLILRDHVYLPPG